MLDPKFVFLGLLISSYGTFSYVRDTIRGKTKPNRVAWFLWGIAPMVAFAAEITEGVGLRSAMTFWVGFGPLLIFAASFVNKNSYWKISRFDYGCAALSIVALVLWALTRTGNIAIVLSLLADALAGIPIFVKAYNHPQTETPILFALAGINSSITLLTVDELTIATMAFPLYILLINISLVAIIKKFHRKAVTLSAMPEPVSVS